MFPWLYEQFFEPEWPFVVLRVLRYPGFRAMGAGIFAFLFSVLLTPVFVYVMDRLGVWEETRGFSLVAVRTKRTIPSMGGVVIVLSILTSVLLWCRLGDSQVWLLAFAAVFLGGTGAVDDYLKVKRRGGLPRPAKYIACFAFAAVVVWFVLWPETSPFENRELRWELYLPFIKHGFDLGLFLIPLLILFLVYFANAVNLTDGLDGLASVPVIMSSAVLGLFAYILAFQQYVDYLLFFPSQSEAGIHYQSLQSANLVVVCAGLAGAVGGFLWHNAYPATVIMGDTGSLALGGMLGTIGVLLKQELLLVIAGGVFLLETASSFVQYTVGIKLFGRRIFYRAPFHDTLLYRGTGESKVTVRLWLLSAFFALIALTTLKLR